MLGHDFYFQTFRKIEVAFGRLFNDIFVKRFDSDGNEVERIKVPLSYAPKEPWYVQRHQDPTLDREISLTLPRMGYMFTGLGYDAGRHLPSIGRNTHVVADQTKRKMQYNPVPYNVDMALFVLAGSIDESHQIIEQILPFFGPDFTVDIKTMIPMERIDSVQFIIGQPVPLALFNELRMTDDRITGWAIPFTAKVHFYGPMTEQGIIRKVQIDYHLTPTATDFNESENVPRHERYTVTPDPVDADPGEQTGYIETVEHFDDGKVYDPVTDTDVDPD